MCLLAAFVPHRPNKYFHVTASNGIVSNSPYTPLAIMTASPIASVRVFDPRCRCRLATFAALPTPSMIEPIIMLNNHRFWDRLLAPHHHQVRRSHRSIHCWHGHAARRSALPRERFSPLAQSGRSSANNLKVIGSNPIQDLNPARGSTKRRLPAGHKDSSPRTRLPANGKTGLPRWFRDVANLRHRAKHSRHHTKDKQRFVVSVVAYDSLPGHQSYDIPRFSTTLYDAAPIRERNVVRQLIDRSTLHWRSLV